MEAKIKPEDEKNFTSAFSCNRPVGYGSCGDIVDSLIDDGFSHGIHKQFGVD